jgi:hypothetical protein
MNGCLVRIEVYFERQVDNEELGLAGMTLSVIGVSLARIWRME